MIKEISKELKKVFSGSEKGVEMKKENVLPDMAATELAAQLAVAQESLISQAASFSALQEQFTQLSVSFAEAQASLASVEAAKQQLVADAAAKKLAHRKESLEMAIGTDKAPSMLASLEVLDDAAFEAVVASMSAGLEREAKTDMFVEKGASSKEEVAPITHAQNLKNFLKNK